MNPPQPLNPSASQLHKAFLGKRVWLSGHTGFKGSWLSEWLLDLGAVVHGYALAPDTTPALFDQLGLADRLEHEVADIRDAEAVRRSIHTFRPDFVFHMAAQPLVRRSYAIPVETYETNVMGTVNVLEALRSYAERLKGEDVESLKSDESSQPRNPLILKEAGDQLLNSSTPQQSQRSVVAVIVTTDKCYENHESGRAYEETDPLGGHDPYSSSKAMAEIATAAYRNSYFLKSSARIASARAGNVIGGGDWAEDRIVPDAMRALDRGEKIRVRNPRAVRPWQHVLEPLSGYLQLASMLANAESNGGEVEPLRSNSAFQQINLSTPQQSANADTKPLNPSTAELCSAFNFGPGPDSNRTVEDLVTEILKNRIGSWTNVSAPSALHEATLLNLSIEKAHRLLDWEPKWSFEETIRKTVSWYESVHARSVTPLEITCSQINDYQED
jgi:CDP-glucose 4,6-dehydratase